MKCIKPKIIIGNKSLVDKNNVPYNMSIEGRTKVSLWTFRNLNTKVHFDKFFEVTVLRDNTENKNRRQIVGAVYA